MSRLGPLTFGKKEEANLLLGREISQHRDFSEETARQIDLEVRRLIDEAYQSAHTIVEANQDAMHRIAAALLERETIDAEEVRMLIAGEELPPLRSVLASPMRQGQRRLAAREAGERWRSQLPRRLALTGVTRFNRHSKKATPQRVAFLLFGLRREVVSELSAARPVLGCAICSGLGPCYLQVRPEYKGASNLGLTRHLRHD